MNKTTETHRPIKVLVCIAWIVLVSCLTCNRAIARDDATDDSCSAPLTSVFKQVSPAVVFISAVSINPYRMSDRVEHIVGSGFIVDRSGLILTNSHVVFGRQLIDVTLDDGSTVPAQLIGADPIFDVALLRIPKPTQGVLNIVDLGDSDRVQVGEEVIAIGNPLGLDQSLTRGVISAINRVLPETFFSLQEPLLQMDTPVNPGNSGGPLVNRCGQVVGITTSVIPDAQNIGFSIPINMAKNLVPALMKDGKIIRPWLGFHGQYMENGLQELFRFPLVQGFLIEVVEPGSPAEKVGLEGGQLELTLAGRDFLIGGDVITKVNGTSLTSPDKLLAALNSLHVGSHLRLQIFRQGKYLDVSYVLPERPILPGDAPDRLSLASPNTRPKPHQPVLRL
ncbi:MAG TPA: trypsin-like peptidase domain-containing protein [Pyrinomonadaceae bacterium]|jgi:serine protease Do|nr:trypsin-like peptidase domain-containing protein [Pyrinomonadaceae bacterium]